MIRKGMDAMSIAHIALRLMAAMEDKDLDPGTVMNAMLHTTDDSGAMEKFLSYGVEVLFEQALADGQWGGVENDKLRSMEDWRQYIGRQLHKSNAASYDNPEIARGYFLKVAGLALSAIRAIDANAAKGTVEIDAKVASEEEPPCECAGCTLAALRECGAAVSTEILPGVFGLRLDWTKVPPELVERATRYFGPKPEAQAPENNG